MGSITVQRTVSHSPDIVWPALADFGGIYRFHPLVERSQVHPGTPTTGLGAERTCHFHDGNKIDERVVGFEDGKSLDVEIYEGTMPLKTARARMEIRPAGEGQTAVTMSMEYTPKFGVMGRAMDVLMMNRKFRQILTSVLAALDEHLTTGETIGPKFRPSKAA